MRKLLYRFIPAALILALSLGACGGGTGGTNVSLTDTGNVNGVVRDVSGNLLAGVTVSIGSVSSTTANGAYNLNSVPVGSVTITATASG